MIDFGLARRFVDDAGMVLPPRSDAAFRGSTTYASLSAHEGEDLGAPSRPGPPALNYSTCAGLRIDHEIADNGEISRNAAMAMGILVLPRQDMCRL